jgi:hypothetical protein
VNRQRFSGLGIVAIVANRCHGFVQVNGQKQARGNGQRFDNCFCFLRREEKRERNTRARETLPRWMGGIMALYPDALSAATEPPCEPPLMPADVMEGCPHRWACRMQLERLDGRVVDDSGFGWMDDLARLLGCGEDCECLE